MRFIGGKGWDLVVEKQTKNRKRRGMDDKLANGEKKIYEKKVLNE